VSGGIEPNCDGKVGNRFIGIALYELRVAAGDVEARGLATQTYGLREIRYGPIGLVESEARLSTPVVGRGIIGLKAQGLRVVGDGILVGGAVDVGVGTGAVGLDARGGRPLLVGDNLAARDDPHGVDAAFLAVLETIGLRRASAD
jgi:hypothetical protein